MTADEYLKNPCRASSIPLWKAKRISVPDSVRVVHEADFDKNYLEAYEDEPYFRIKHTLHAVIAPELPEHFYFCAATIEEFAEHINSCYTELGITSDELKSYQNHPVYVPNLWLAVRDDRTGMIAASGIGEVDREIREGTLEWVQVSSDFRRLGLGSCVVQELLCRMKGQAEFVTVSGQCKNASNPEALYRKCGFVGNDIWHILKKR